MFSSISKFHTLSALTFDLPARQKLMLLTNVLQLGQPTAFVQHVSHDAVRLPTCSCHINQVKTSDSFALCCWPLVSYCHKLPQHAATVHDFTLLFL